MRKMMKSIAAVLAVSALMAGSAFAADKLIVKDSGGTNNVFAVTDSGQVSLPVSVGTGRGAAFKNPGSTGTLDNFAFVAATPDGSVPNAGLALQMIPKGTGFNANIKAQLSVFGTDYVADPVNYEFLALRATGTSFTINSATGGTGILRPIQFQIANTAKMTIGANGYIGIGTTTPTHLFEVASGTIAISPATQTTAPAAGGAAALPATPAGYMTITINGVDRMIPYY